YRPGVAEAVGRRDLGPPPGRAVPVAYPDPAHGSGLPCRAAGSRRGEVLGMRRRRDRRRDPGVELHGQANVEVGAEWPGNLVGEELAHRTASDPAYDLADEEALGQRVVARGRARFP